MAGQTTAERTMAGQTTAEPIMEVLRLCLTGLWLYRFGAVPVNFVKLTGKAVPSSKAKRLLPLCKHRKARFCFFCQPLV